MSYQSTAYNVMIASPGDIQPEREIVRNIIDDWNTVNASTQKTVLMPVGWETHSTPLMGARAQSTINWQVLKDSDLLICAFWTRLGTPTGKAPSGTVEELEEHIAANKPALIYFSNAPVVPDSFDQDQYNALKAFKESCRNRGLLYTYDSIKEFEAKIRNHLGLTLNTHPYFAASRQPVASAGAVSRAPLLSPEAKQLLTEAAADGGDVMILATMGGTYIQANGKNFVTPNDPRSLALWKATVNELHQKGYLEAVGNNGEFYRVTNDGYLLIQST